jgi:hypothetical protein
MAHQHGKTSQVVHFWALLLLSFTLGACTPKSVWPSSWEDRRTWTFDIVGQQSEATGTVEVELLDEPVHTCRPGTWKRARIVASTVPMFRFADWYEGGWEFAAYQVSGAVIEIQLRASLCGFNLALVANLDAANAAGELKAYGLGWRTPLGRLSGRPAG